MKRELPVYARTSTAVRVWSAGPEDGEVCTYYVRMFGDDEKVSHPVVDPYDMWWVALPVAVPKHPEELGPGGPDLADVVCSHCLPMAIYTTWQSWIEANMDAKG